MKPYLLIVVLSLFFYRLQSQCYIPYIEYNKWGLLNDSLHEVIVPKYDYIKNYNDDFWIYRNGLKYGVLDKNLQEILPANYQVFYWIDKQKFLALENQQYVLRSWLDNTSFFLEVDTIHQAFSNFMLVEVNRKYGILNYRMEWLIPPVYDEILTNGKDIIILEDNLYYYVDTLHRKRYIKGFQDAYFFSEGLAFVKEDDLYGFINEQFQWVTNKEFLNAQSFQEGLAPVERNHRWGFINKNNQLVIPYIYDYVFPFERNRAIVQFKGKWGVIQPSGRIVIPLEYDEILPFESNLWLIRVKHLWGIKNEKGEWLVKPEFVDFRRFHCNYWMFFYENRNSVIIDKQGVKVWKNI